MIRVGDKLRVRMVCGAEGVATRDSFPARVIYIHPRRGWYTAELELPGGTVRESYFQTTTPAAELPQENRRARLP